MKVISKQQKLRHRLAMTMLSFILVINVLTVSGVPLKVQAATNTFYVSSNGDDINEGSEEQPFATIERAAEAVDTSSPGTIILLNDITLSEGLLLNGATGGNVQGKELTITSKSGNRFSIIRDASFNNHHLIHLSSANITFNNIIIDGNNVEVQNYNGIYIQSSPVAFENVEVKNHYIHGSSGGISAIMTYGSGAITIIRNGTVIRDNNITGRVNDNPPSVLGAGSRGRLIIEGGLITNNTVEGDSNGVIVGIGLYQTPSFKMVGGRITGNHLYGQELNGSETVGNVAVYMRGTSAQARFEFGGTAYVYDNFNSAGEQRNVFLKNAAARDNAYLSLVESMQDGARVGVYANIMPTEANPIIDIAVGYGGYTAVANDAIYFIPDKATVAVVDFEPSSNKVILRPIPPELNSVWLDLTTVDGNEITLTFSDNIQLNDLEGFTITVGGILVTPTLYTVDGDKLLVTLPNEPTADIQLIYTKGAHENLKGQNNIAVEDFTFDYHYSFVTALAITSPAGTPAQVIEPQPQITGTVAADSTVNVVIKDQNGDVVTGAGGVATVVGVAWEFTPNIPLSNGEYTIEVEATKDGQKVTVEKGITVTLADKTALQNKVTEVDGLIPAHYTSESWAGLEPELTNARNVLNNPTAQQTEIDDALNALNNKVAELALKVPTSATLNSTTNTITIPFDYNIMVNGTDGFVVTIDGHNIDPSDIDSITVGANSNTLELTLASAISLLPDSKVIVDYIKSVPANVTGPHGKAVENFSVEVEDSYSATLQITQPITSTITTSNSTFGGTVAANTTTPSTVNVILTDAANNQIPGQTTVNPTTGEWTFVPDTALPDGTYTLTVTATDGTQTATKTKPFTVATQPVVGQGLSALTPSIGSLSPSFQTDTTDYTMNVGYPTSAIDFTAIPVESNATVTTTVNGQPGTLNQIPLQVGWNTIVMTVTDANGNVKQYTIKVYREASSGSGGNTGGGGTTTPAPTPTPEAPKETKTIIHVDLEVDGEHPLEKTTVEIERTTHPDGRVTDFVNLTPAQALEAVEKAKEIDNTIARIVIPDVQDAVDQVTVEVPKESLQILRDNGLDLEIATDNAHIAIPNSSMNGVADNFYFRLVPVKKESERQAIEERARAERVVRETLQSNDVHVVARPMTIETNLPSRPVVVTLPLKGVDLPTNAAERQAFLASLAIFIEHTDGEKKVVRPEVVTMQVGKLGLRFTVEKFSTFTIIQVAKEAEGTHTAYIQGFPDGTFGPDKNVTRAQVAFMLARILGYTEEQVNQAPFKDVQTNHPAAGAIAFVKEQGIMNGDNEGNFHAGANITRAEMATVVSNFKELAVEENVSLTFKDTKGHWAQWIIEANRTAGIINGLENDRFAPNAALTRAQAVVMINRMFDRGPLYGVTVPSFPDVKGTHWAFSEIEEAANTHSYYIDEDGNEQQAQ
ncbi:S-layer homology domain-containing protein [Lysinibacillus sp. FSL H8-0500]|uniref:S-layer homology domain-containing protein n=1 Tax=Lysinibacillus sp. FSL H8-0500 TaxID=2921393 RepID=UPI003101590D